MDDDSLLNRIFLQACRDALNGSFPCLEQVDHISSYLAQLLWWINEIERKMINNDGDLLIQNSNLLTSTLYALRHGICAKKLELQNDDISSLLVQKLLKLIFYALETYRNSSCVVEEAMAVLDAMEKSDYFCSHFDHLLEKFKEISNKDIAERRQLYAVGATAACKSNDQEAVDKYIQAALKPFIDNSDTLEMNYRPSDMLIAIDVLTGIGDALKSFPHKRSYGLLVKNFYDKLNSFYNRYHCCKEVMEKILEFIAVAMPALFAYSIYSKDVYIDETTLNFVHLYCEGQVRTWNLIDLKKDTSSYYDLVKLMNIAQGILVQLAISCSDDEGDVSSKTVGRIGIRFLDIFLPCTNETRFSVPDVTEAFLNLLQTITEFDALYVINYIKSFSDPLPSCLLQIIHYSYSNELVYQTFSILDSILQHYDIIYKKKAWRDFFRYALNSIFQVVITSSKGDSCYLLARDCLFYIVFADTGFFDFYCEQITENQPVQLQRVMTDAFRALSSFENVQHHTEICRRQFVHNYHRFRRAILGNLRFDPDAIKMTEIIDYYVRKTGDKLNE